MNRYRAVHPGEECLLRYADGELKGREAAHIREHLEACWRCRAEFEDLQQTITEYVAYQQATLQVTPNPPQPWNGFNTQLERLIAQRENSWWRRASQFLNGLLTDHRVPVASLSVVLLVCLVIFELNRPATVSAAELLNRAAAHEKGVVHHRRLHIRTRTSSFTRAAVVTPGYRNEGSDGDTEHLRDLFVAANYSWENPLSAVSFAAWREHLPDRHDEIGVLPNPKDSRLKVYRIRTSTRSSILEEATLSIQTDDYDVVSGTFRFRDNEWVEMTELLEEPAPSFAAGDAPETKLGQTPEPTPVETAPAIMNEAAQELQVMAALRSAEADLGEQIEMSQDQDRKLVVTATGLAPERQEVLRRSLAGIAGVVLHFYEPQAPLVRAPDLQESTPRPKVTPDGPTALQLWMERAVGGASAFERFTNQVLEANQAAMARVYALHRLAERFPPDVEAKLGKKDSAILVQLRRDHMEPLAQHIRDIARLMKPVLDSAGVGQQAVEPVSEPRNWQDATGTLLSAIRHTDQLLTLIITGAGTDPSSHLLAETAEALQAVDTKVARFEPIIAAVSKEGH